MFLVGDRHPSFAEEVAEFPLLLQLQLQLQLQLLYYALFTMFILVSIVKLKEKYL